MGLTAARGGDWGTTSPAWDHHFPILLEVARPLRRSRSHVREPMAASVDGGCAGHRLRWTSLGEKRTRSSRLSGLQQEAKARRRRPWIFSDLDLIHLFLSIWILLHYLRASGCWFFLYMVCSPSRFYSKFARQRRVPDSLIIFRSGWCGYMFVQD
jgi:hypothetical protein